MNKKIRTKLMTACMSFTYVALILGIGATDADAHCGGKHTGNHPHCANSPPPPPPPPPPPTGNADPQVVYRDGGIFLANADGTNQTEIRPGGVSPHLDAPGKRVLFHDYPSLGNLNYVGLIPYGIVNGNIEVGPEQVLVTDADTGGDFSSFGMLDWSPGGDRYAYTYRFKYGEDDGYVHRIMVSPDGTDSVPAQHTVAWEGAPDGGQGAGVWDASGDYIYLLEEFNLGVPQILIVIDIRTDPGTEVARFDITPLIVAAGFAADSNGGPVSASYLTGTPSAPGDPNGSYSFDPGNPDVLARSDTSLCLLMGFVDWSTRGDTRFTMIFDMPALFDPASTLRCPISNMSGSPIVDFEPHDFTAGDAGIVGMDTRKNRVTGISVYDIGTGSVTKIIDSGGFPDWSN